MKINEVHQIEKDSNEVWVVSPNLHFDVKDKNFQKLVKANLKSKTKYRYIVPNNEETRKNINSYKKKYGLTEAKIDQMFLMLPGSEWSPFLNECAIYNPGKRNAIACSAPGECAPDEDVIQFNKSHCKEQTENFRKLWKQYKRQNP